MLPQHIINLAQSERVVENFASFYKRAFATIHPTTIYHHNWHIDYLSEILQDCSEFKIPKIIINISPGTSKSTMISQAYVAYCLGKDPGLYNMCVSNTLGLATEHSRKTRTIMQSQWYMDAFPDTRIVKDQNAKLKFDTTMGGTREACTSKSGATGKGAHNLIFDDFLNTEYAKSNTVREDLVGGVGANFLTRLRDNTEGGKKCIMIVEQRLHDADLTGRFKDDGYMHVVLPAYWEKPSTISYGNFKKEIKDEDFEDDGRYYFDKVRMGKQFLVDKQSELRDEFSGQFLQDPVMKGGNIVKIDWFRQYFTGHLPKFKTIIVSCDTAYKAGQLNDPSCFIAIGVTKDEDYYIIDVVNKRFDYPGLKKALVAFLDKHKPHKILIEDKASGQSLIQELSSTKYTPTKINPKDYGGDKEVRFTNCTDTIEVGKVYLPEKADWLNEFEAQVTRFPKAPHDDMCFVAGTKIATKRGQINIEEITLDDEVMTPFGFFKVLECGLTKESEVISSSGLTGTKGHKVFTFDDDFVRMDSLTHTNNLSKITLCNMMKTTLLKLLNLKGSNIDEWEEVENTTCLNPELTKDGGLLKAYMSLYTSLIQERKFKEAFMFTTRIVTHLITTLRTFSVYRLVCTIDYLKMLILKSRKPISIKSDPCRLLGIGLRKVGSGIVRMLKARNLGHMKLNVFNVRKYSSQNERITLNSAVENVLMTTEAKVIQPTLRNVSCATLSSKPLLTGLNVAQQNVTIKNGLGLIKDVEVKVYNLKVDKIPLYYANGVLVHNCDALSQALNWLKTRRTKLRWATW